MVAMSTSTIPFMVQAVFDEEELGRDFAYTIGLHRFGRPELHLRSRPTHGDDPGGADWHLSMNDLGSILNRLGMSVLRREVAVGSKLDNACDGGATTLKMRLDPPEAAESLEA